MYLQVSQATKAIAYRLFRCICAKAGEMVSENHYFTVNSQKKDIMITCFVNNKSFANIWW